MAFEIDDRLIPILADTLGRFDNVTVVNQDILKTDLQTQIQNFKNPDLPIKVVANLPYYITTPILMHLIESKIPFSEFVVMMRGRLPTAFLPSQTPKLTAPVHCGPVLHDCQGGFHRASHRLCARTKRGLRHSQNGPSRATLVSVKDEDFFFRVSKASFVHRRKTLWNNLTNHFGKSEEVKDKLTQALGMAELESSVRGEALSMADFARLSDSLQEVGLS